MAFFISVMYVFVVLSSGGTFMTESESETFAMCQLASEDM
jgi:hypothetical protein